MPMLVYSRDVCAAAISSLIERDTSAVLFLATSLLLLHVA